ncbi:ParB/RepB/Spo0J family partition protein [Candidatus Parcubacteria bacterium]|nr:MAG: ParB/RepB/Spo0J family partition protein [Candidatus Parcubacteria bacterium]
MTNPLGKGLESLIPGKATPPPEPEPLDVLHGQKELDEPMHRFHDGGPMRQAASAPGSTGTAAPVNAAASTPLPPRTIQVDTPGRMMFSAQPIRGDSIFWIEITKIEPNPFQPRRVFDAGELTALAQSIRDHGVLQPLLVTKVTKDTPSGVDVRYQLIAGERRWRASKLAGLRTVPVIVRGTDTSDQAKLELALIENVQREDLNAIERAKAFQQLIDEFRLGHQDIAKRIGKSREMVTNTLRLLRLPKEMQDAISGGVITEGHARALLMLDPEPDKQQQLFREMQQGPMSVRAAELAARALGGAKVQKRSKLKNTPVDPDLQSLRERLEELFGTKVSLIRRGERGRIIVEFYSDEELQGIMGRIVKE